MGLGKEVKGHWLLDMFKNIKLMLFPSLWLRRTELREQCWSTAAPAFTCCRKVKGDREISSFDTDAGILQLPCSVPTHTWEE